MNLTKENLLEIGFKELPHFTIGNNLVYEYESTKHGKFRVISIANYGTPVEFITIGELQDDRRIFEDIVVIHNYDYDGYYTIERMKALIFALTGNQIT